ncbi:right-handed parallel beta-helix repeat-containing protein [Candidatus Woesearchaeota archaeon]|nr:right-handed parallel beta-helix repeat-containing protein [Candidatus Woesearchaeota archaeon]
MFKKWLMNVGLMLFASLLLMIIGYNVTTYETTSLETTDTTEEGFAPLVKLRSPFGINQPTLPGTLPKIRTGNSCPHNSIWITQSDLDRSPSSNGPFQILNPGYYCLKENIIIDSSNPNPRWPFPSLIWVNSDSVTIDLNGKEIIDIADPNHSTFFPIAILIGAGNRYWYNFTLNPVSDVTIMNGKIRAMRGVAAYGSTSSPIKKITIENLKFHSDGGGTGGIIMGDAKDVLINNNYFEGQEFSSIEIFNIENVLIDKNSLNLNKGDGIVATNIKGLKIKNNQFLNHQHTRFWSAFGGDQVYDTDFDNNYLLKQPIGINLKGGSTISYKNNTFCHVNTPLNIFLGSSASGRNNQINPPNC